MSEKIAMTHTGMRSKESVLKQAMEALDEILAPCECGSPECSMKVKGPEDWNTVYHVFSVMGAQISHKKAMMHGLLVKCGHQDEDGLEEFEEHFGNGDIPRILHLLAVYDACVTRFFQVLRDSPGRPPCKADEFFDYFKRVMRETIENDVNAQFAEVQNEPNSVKH